jgi:hypothetical protein
MTSPRIHLHQGDLPEGLTFTGSVAVDTETLGLKPHRDRLCLVQLSAGDNTAHLVQFNGRDWDAPRLKALLSDPAIIKIFHYGRFDIAVLQRYLGVTTQPVWCTKIASKLVRTYTVEAAAKFRLGCGVAFPTAARLCGVRRALPAPAEGAAGDDARAAGADRDGAGVLPLPADAGSAGPRRLR